MKFFLNNFFPLRGVSFLVLIYGCFLIKSLTPCLAIPFGKSHSIGLQNPVIKVKAMDFPAFPDTALKDTVPEKKDTMISASALKSEVEYSAKDSIVFKIGENKAYLYGEAKVTYKKLKLEAGFITLNWKTKTIYAEELTDSMGNPMEAPVFFDKGQKYRAKRIAYNFDTKKGKLYQLITKEGKGIIHGEEIKKDQYDIIFGNKAKYTTCEREDPHFYIAAKKIKIIPKDKIITGPANLVVEEVPLPAVLPFGFFPNQKEQASGIIFPGYGESAQRGFYLEDGGYYFGISDHFDLSLTGDIYTNGSWLVNTLTRYANRYHYSGRLMVEYGENRFGDPETPDFRLSKDFSMRWDHRQDPKARPNSTFNASVNIASKNSLINNSDQTNEIVKNNLRSSVSYGLTIPGTPFAFNTSASHSQNLASRSLNLSLPEGSFTMGRWNPFKNSNSKVISQIGFPITIDFKNSINTYDSVFFNSQNVFGDFKNGFRFNLPLSTNLKVLKYFTLNPGIDYTGFTYFKRERKVYDSENDTVINQPEKGLFTAHQYSVRAGFSTRLYGLYKINALGISGIRHVVTPNINFRYSPDFSQPEYGYYDKVQVNSEGKIDKYSLYRNNIFGGPGDNESGRIGFNLQNNLEMKVRKETDTGMTLKKVTLLEDLSLNTGYNMLADSFKLNKIGLNARTTILDVINFQLSTTMNPYAYNRQDSSFYDKISVIQPRGRLVRIEQALITVNTSLNPRTLSGKESPGSHGIPLVASPYYYNYVDFTIPWNLSLGYNLRYSKNYGRPALPSNVTQSVDMSGDLSLTDKWKIGFRTGYDLKEKEFTISSVNITRDLHCWVMRFDWIPFGSRQQYTFSLNVRAQVLKDLKLEKEQKFWDANRF